jgi:hypothetical protein
MIRVQCIDAQAQFYSWAALQRPPCVAEAGYGSPPTGGRKAALSRAAQAYAEEIALGGGPLHMLPLTQLMQHVCICPLPVFYHHTPNGQCASTFILRREICSCCPA